jgi:hypothetical protein
MMNSRRRIRIALRPSKGVCNGGNDITPNRAALRDFNPAYVGSGSTPLELKCDPVPNDPQRQRQDDNASPEPEEEYIRVHWKLTSFSGGIVRLRRCSHIIFMQGRRIEVLPMAAAAIIAAKPCTVSATAMHLRPVMLPHRRAVLGGRYLIITLTFAMSS